MLGVGGREEEHIKELFEEIVEDNKSTEFNVLDFYIRLEIQRSKI